LWIASADGRDARRILKGHFTLPAWSDDGQTIAVAEKKEGGRRWDICIVQLPPSLRTPR
jgi:Tol biopolymer transport system component